MPSWSPQWDDELEDLVCSTHSTIGCTCDQDLRVRFFGLAQDVFDNGHSEQEFVWRCRRAVDNRGIKSLHLDLEPVDEALEAIWRS